MKTKLMNSLPVLLALALIGLLGFVLSVRPAPASGATFSTQAQTDASYASSTAITLTWGRSFSVLGTSTNAAATATSPETRGRTAVSFQIENCPAGTVWLSFNDTPAATTTGYKLATTTPEVVFGDKVPMVYGAIRALASTATCTLLVNEFRSQ